MKSAFLLQHMHFLPNGEESIKVIGIYSSLRNAKATVQQLSSKPGFCSYPNIVDPQKDDEEQGFYIDEYHLDVDHWEEGFVTMIGNKEYQD